VTQPRKPGPGRGAYAEAGVDQEGKNSLLERLGAVIARATTPEVVAAVGPFAGLHRVPAGGGLLAASADGVGTKIKLAVATGRHRGIGWDLVNHCVNDIATAGADPLFFLDYLGSSQLEPAVVEQVITGLAEACAAAGCALLGGETAEMPGVYAPDDYDLVGFIVGHVPSGFTREPVLEGDVLCALPSSGLHTNGYTLVRRLFAGWDLEQPVPELGRPLADELLEPHRSYLEPLRLLPWKAAAHITGGGLPGNVPRALPEGLAAEVRRDSWRFPPVFTLLQRLGNLSDDEMVATFNCGLGMILVCERPLPGLQTVGRVVRATDRGRFRLV
jgi:phosphoribosylformylglycinamidine cyclo-ligase